MDFDQLNRIAICFGVIGVVFGVLWYARWINTPTDYPLSKTGRFNGHPDDWSDAEWNDYCNVVAAKRFWRRLMFWR